VGVHIDDAGRDDHAVGVDRLARVVGVEARECRNPPVAHAHVDAPARQPRPVDDEAAPNDQVVTVAHDWSRAANAATLCRTTKNDRPSGPAVKPYGWFASTTVRSKRSIG
jgi:hypothetical protein